MIESICPVCLENKNTEIIYCSDGYLYDKKCFDALNLMSPITREKITYHIPLEKIENNTIKLEKECRNNTSLITYDSQGYNQYGFDIKGFDKDGFDKFGFDKDGFNRDKVLVDIDKTKKAIKVTYWNIYYAVESVRDNYDLIKECIENEPNTYMYASSRLKNDIKLAEIFIKKGGTFNLLNKNHRNNKSIAKLAVEINPKIYNQLNKKLKDNDDIFKIVIKLDKRAFGFASERLRSIYNNINDDSN